MPEFNLFNPRFEDIEQDFFMMKQDILRAKSADRIAQYYHFSDFYRPQVDFWRESMTSDQKEDFLNHFHRKFPGTQTYDRFYTELSKYMHTPKFTNFNVMMLDQLIHQYHPKTFVDPTMGWGHRMLMAMAHDIKYVGLDIRKEAVTKNRRMGRELGAQPKDVRLICGDGATLGGEKTKDFDLLFTSPPYYDAEIYSDLGVENSSYTEYLNWWKKLATNAYNNHIKIFAFQITPKYGVDLCKMTEAAGYKKIDEIKNTRDNGTLSTTHIDTKGRKSKRQFGRVYVFSLEEEKL